MSLLTKQKNHSTIIIKTKYVGINSEKKKPKLLKVNTIYFAFYQPSYIEMFSFIQVCIEQLLLFSSTKSLKLWYNFFVKMLCWKKFNLSTQFPLNFLKRSNNVPWFRRVLAIWNQCVMAVSGLLKIRQIATILGNNSANSLQKPRPDECCKFWGLEIRQQSCFSNHSPVKTKNRSISGQISKYKSIKHW